MTDLILASASQTRRRPASAAGLAFRVVPADVDEDALRRDFGRLDDDLAPARMAVVLAAAKAVEVSRRHPRALVISGDQILALGREIATKPADLAAARDGLRRLSGRTHQLHSGVALALGGTTVWQHVETAGLTMRPLSDGFIDDYLAKAGERICACVGAYELEGLGIQLFQRIDGDYFTILGLPLLALLGELRRRGVLVN